MAWLVGKIFSYRNRTRFERLVKKMNIPARTSEMKLEKYLLATFSPIFSRKIINWESKTRSFSFLMVFILATWFFQLWMIPFGLTAVLAREISYKILTGSWTSVPEELEETEIVVEDDKKSTLEKIQNSVYHVQQFLGSFSSFFESLENVFNISIPFLSIICLAALVLTTILLYFLSLRTIIIVWGVNKLTKKIIRPWSTSNNEVMDFLSRVPDRVQLKLYKDDSTHK